MAKENTNKEQSLAEALEKIDMLSTENEKLNTKLQEFENKLVAESNQHLLTKESLRKSQLENAQLQKAHRDIDNEVAVKVAQVASESGVEPIEAQQNPQGEESLEDLAKRIENASGVEKAKLIESNAEKIMNALKGKV